MFQRETAAAIKRKVFLRLKTKIGRKIMGCCLDKSVAVWRAQQCRFGVAAAAPGLGRAN